MAGSPLEALYPIVYLDCIHAKVRDSGAVRVKAVYLALGVNGSDFTPTKQMHLGYFEQLGGGLRFGLPALGGHGVPFNIIS
jgi:hypothetical protein